MLSRILLLAATATTTVLAGNAYMPSLPDEVMADLAKRDPSEYQTFAWRDADQIEKRGPPNDLYGLQTRCLTSHCYDFTFDDGPYKNMRAITDTAVKNGIKVTFMVNVLNYDCAYDEPYASDLKHAYDSGMQICSHTATHPHLNSLTHAQIDDEVNEVETALYKIIGAVPSCIRPPYGEANDEVVSYLNNKHNLVVVNWNYDSGDSTGSSVAQSKAVLRTIKSPKHAIVLMHETEDTTADRLFPAAITIAKNNGYTAANMQTIPQSLKFNGYKVVGKPGKRDSTWTCNGIKIN
jgi:peptidoglycan/xylan/chitin deacetylase (PgdA/CDA1 family)